jgi:hypothetical protein
VKIFALPLRTLVAHRKSLSGPWRTRSKSTDSAIVSRSGLKLNGLSWYGESTFVIRSMMKKAGDSESE